MPINQTQEEFNKQYGNNYTQEEFNQKYGTDGQIAEAHANAFNKGPFEGKLSDYLFQQTSVGRVLSAFGQGASDGWGSAGGSVEDSELKWEKEQKDADKGIVYGFHTAVMRPAAWVIDHTLKPTVATVSAGFGGIGQAVGQTGEELSKTSDQSQGIATKIATGASGELLRGLSSGAGLEGGLGLHEAVRAVQDPIRDLQDARSKGIIGEGEAGYFNTVKPSPKDIQARQEAAVQAGEPYGPVTREEFLGPKLVPNQTEIARQIDPDTFKELDRLQQEQDNLRTSRDYTTSKILPKEEIKDRETYLEQERLQKSLQQVPERLQKIDEQLRDIIPDVADAKKRSEELLQSDSPEGHAFRNLIQAQAFEKAIALQEAKPKVQAAYRDAADIIPVPEGKTDANSTNSGKSSAFAPKTPSAADQIVSVLPEYRGGLKDVKGGELKESGLNKNIMIDAVQKGFDAKFQDAPLYHSITHADQGQKAFDYLEANEKAAMEVAMGDREPPTGIHPEAILMALKEKAEAEGDIDMIQSLSQTRLGREASVMGQRLGLLRNLRENIDPTEILRGIQELWQEKGSEKITKTIEDIQDTIQKNMTNLHNEIGEWLKSIECDY